jgi:hypothetical protein
MGIQHYRGQLLERTPGKVIAAMLYQQVTLEDHLAAQYPPLLRKRYSDQASRNCEAERSQIAAAMLPGDTLWLWVRREGWADVGGIAIRRGSAVPHAWVVWWWWREDESDDPN